MLGDLSSILGTHMVAGENQLQQVDTGKINKYEVKVSKPVLLCSREHRDPALLWKMKLGLDYWAGNLSSSNTHVIHLKHFWFLVFVVLGSKPTDFNAKEALYY